MSKKHIDLHLKYRSDTHPAALIRDFSKKYDQVIPKVPDSAGSYGNIKFSSNKLSGLSAAVVQDRLLAQLHLRGWHDDEHFRAAT